MVTVKVRETYDLHTVKDKMTVIAIHTPKPDILKKNFPGLLMQCKAYRPVSADVVLSCASVLPLDPQGVGTGVGDVSPEDVFNPILYSAISNKGMSQLESRINAMREQSITVDVSGSTAFADTDDLTNKTDEFNVYYGLLSNSHGWKKANAQAGIVMRDLRPLVYEMVYAVGDVSSAPATATPEGSYPLNQFGAIGKDGSKSSEYVHGILGKSKPFPFINCTAYSGNSSGQGQYTGFTDSNPVINHEVDVPYLNVICGAIIVPPCRLHELFFRMTVTWSVEFSSIRPISEITDWTGLASVGAATHYINYSYSSAKQAVTGSDETILDNDVCMVSANVEVDKVM